MRISLQRFYKTFHKYLANAFHYQPNIWLIMRNLAYATFPQSQKLHQARSFVSQTFCFLNSQHKCACFALLLYRQLTTGLIYNDFVNIFDAEWYIGGFNLHLLVFPFVYQFNSRIWFLVHSSFVNDQFRGISTTFQHDFKSCSKCE